MIPISILMQIYKWLIGRTNRNAFAYLLVIAQQKGHVSERFEDQQLSDIGRSRCQHDVEVRSAYVPVVRTSRWTICKIPRSGYVSSRLVAIANWKAKLLNLETILIALQHSPRSWLISTFRGKQPAFLLQGAGKWTCTWSCPHTPAKCGPYDCKKNNQSQGWR